MILESDWNYHFSGKNEVNKDRPYVSDNKFSMQGGRSTGHFGSGIYFSTYHWEDMDKYNKEGMDNPEFIQVGEHVYRVDFDLYKNMYRVESEKEGHILYTLLNNLNAMYNSVCYKDYDNAVFYQRCAINSKALGLFIPSYRKLTEMMISHSQNDDDVRSFSTVFMEMNDFNGVNVSGIPYYDNTTHGSVIYDIRKLSSTARPLKKNIRYTTDSTYSNTLATDSILGSDAYTDSLLGRKRLGGMKDLDDKTLMRVLRNLLDNGEIMNGKELKYLDNEKVVKRYLKLLYDSQISTRWHEFNEVVFHFNLEDIIAKYKQYYWINYVDRFNRTLLPYFLYEWDDELDWDLTNEEKLKSLYEYLKLLKSYMNRDFTKQEKEEIEYYKDLYSE